MTQKEEIDSVFEALYRDYYRAVYSFFIRSGFPADEARDLAQTSFLRVYKGLETYRGEAQWSWISRIANNVRLNELRYRQAGRRGEGTATVALSDDSLDESRIVPFGQEAVATPFDEVAKRQETRMLNAAFGELDSEEQHYLKLWIQGYSYKEMMVVMQASMDTVKSRLYRAKKALKSKAREKSGHRGLDWPSTEGEAR